MNEQNSPHSHQNNHLPSISPSSPATVVWSPRNAQRPGTSTPRSSQNTLSPHSLVRSPSASRVLSTQHSPLTPPSLNRAHSSIGLTTPPPTSTAPPPSQSQSQSQQYQGQTTPSPGSSSTAPFSPGTPTPTSSASPSTGRARFQQYLRHRQSLHNTSLSSIPNTPPSATDDPFAAKERSIRKRIRSLDFYKKYTSDAPQGLHKKTKLGAFLSLLVLLFLVFLILSEFISFLTVQREDRLEVDKQFEGKIDIYFNISFPSIKCIDLHVDTIDASGEAHIDVHYHVYKHPIDASGRILDFGHRLKKMHSQLMKEQYDETDDPESPYYCGSCGKATTRQRQCCNSCFQVIQQYRNLGMPPPPKEEIDQCVEEISLRHPGCNMYGALRVNKVAGNFHFAPGRSFSREHETYVHHIHEFNPMLIQRFNTSHIVHELNFGPRIAPVTYPLDDVASIVPGGLALHKYFIKVVPTKYTSGFTTVDSYQFSYTKHQQEFDLSQGVMLPGIFFVFDLSAIQISYREFRTPFLHFLVSLCAIVGGVFTVSGLIDRFLHGAVKKLYKKED